MARSLAVVMTSIAVSMALWSLLLNSLTPRSKLAGFCTCRGGVRGGVKERGKGSEWILCVA